MLIVYTPVITNRIRYTFELVFSNLLGLPYTITDDPANPSITPDKPLICYADEPHGTGVFFRAHGLLTQRGIKPQKMQHITDKGIPCLFPVQQPSALSFDPFAAIFYLVSRYEEYLEFPADRFGRYPAEQSWAFKQGVLKKPVVNYYAEKIADLLLERYPSLAVHKPEYQFIATYDIDSAYAYKGKGLLRNLGGLVIDLVNQRFENISKRLKVLFQIEPDPYDTYEWILKNHRTNGVKAIFFFLVGDYDEYDKNLSINTLAYRRLIKNIADEAIVGIHPSFASYGNPSKLKMEVDRLETLLKRDITCSRQHFLRLKIPETYQLLIDAGITDDFTMGYPSQTGFRASIAQPFHFYDLHREMRTHLRVHPFVLMDATYRYYLNLSPDSAIEDIDDLIAECRKFGGTFISLWHNNSLSEFGEWKGWKRVYSHLMNKAVP